MSKLKSVLEIPPSSLYISYKQSLGNGGAEKRPSNRKTFLEPGLCRGSPQIQLISG